MDFFDFWLGKKKFGERSRASNEEEEGSASPSADGLGAGNEFSKRGKEMGFSRGKKSP